MPAELVTLTRRCIMGRELTATENRILKLIQESYGSQNSLDSINWIDDHEAVLWVKTPSDEVVLSANLTTLAAWLEDGTIADEAELKRDWLQIDETP